MTHWMSPLILILFVLWQNVSGDETDENLTVDQWWPYLPPSKERATTKPLTKISENDEYGEKLLPRTHRQGIHPELYRKETIQDDLEYVDNSDSESGTFYDSADTYEGDSDGDDYEERRLDTDYNDILNGIGDYWKRRRLDSDYNDIGDYIKSEPKDADYHDILNERSERRRLNLDYNDILNGIGDYLKSGPEDVTQRRLQSLQPQYPQSYHRRAPNYQRGWDVGWQDAVANRSPQHLFRRPLYKNGYDDGYKIGLAQRAGSGISPDYNYPSYDYPSYDYPSYDYPSYDYPSYDNPSYDYPPFQQPDNNNNAAHLPESYWNGNAEFRRGWLDGHSAQAIK
eukprot:GHVL01005825.1.p1 GENE.GHVL01005825.1~~GHVL01005825.1.p1  ORF type:complete len:340 (+),score=43.78 GHVL01005825.1:67-1086(+)